MRERLLIYKKIFELNIVAIGFLKIPADLHATTRLTSSLKKKLYYLQFAMNMVLENSPLKNAISPT